MFKQRACHGELTSYNKQSTFVNQRSALSFHSTVVKHITYCIFFKPQNFFLLVQTKVQGTCRAIKCTKVWKMMWLLFMLLLFPNLTVHNDLLKLRSVCRNCSTIFFRFRGRYLSRRIAYPSNGSFNPFIISSKEAQIIDGT